MSGADDCIEYPEMRTMYSKLTAVLSVEKCIKFILI